MFLAKKYEKKLNKKLMQKLKPLKTKSFQNMVIIKKKLVKKLRMINIFKA
jgi:hypothetical protein